MNLHQRLCTVLLFHNNYCHFIVTLVSASPQIGLHENVIVLDYDSEYANLIVKHKFNLPMQVSLPIKRSNHVNQSLQIFI